MAYICQNCGTSSHDKQGLCNPVDDWDGNSKLCKDWTHEVCESKAADVEYYCECGNVSADPQYLCNPEKMWKD